MGHGRRGGGGCAEGRRLAQVRTGRCKLETGCRAPRGTAARSRAAPANQFSNRCLLQLAGRAQCHGSDAASAGLLGPKLALPSTLQGSQRTHCAGTTPAGCSLQAEPGPPVGPAQQVDQLSQCLCVCCPALGSRLRPLILAVAVPLPGIKSTQRGRQAAGKQMSKGKCVDVGAGAACLRE